jgi:hypothetical protein
MLVILVLALAFTFWIGTLTGADSAKRKAASECGERLDATAKECAVQCVKDRAVIETAVRGELERRYEYLYRSVFNAQCSRAVCAMRFEGPPWRDPDTGEALPEESTSFWTGPISCVRPGEVPWVKCSNNSAGEFMCLPPPPPGKELP